MATLPKREFPEIAARLEAAYQRLKH